MRMTLVLLLLINLSLFACGCNDAPMSRQAAAAEDAYEVDLNDFAEDAESPDEPEVEKTEPQRLLGPDALNPPSDPQMLKSPSRKNLFYLTCYGGDPQNDGYRRNWGPIYVEDKPQLSSWAIQNGLTIAEANVEGYRYANVRFVDLMRDKVNRDLRFGHEQAKYPTYVLTDQQGQVLWYLVGRMNLTELQKAWDLAMHKPVHESFQRLVDTSIDTSQTHPPKAAEEEGTVQYQCGPNGCKVIRSKSFR